MIISRLSLVLVLVLACSVSRVPAAAAAPARTAGENWTELQTPHFTIFSDGRADQVRPLATRLEQFREAYAALAGVKAVASVPILVFAFANDESFRPFQPLYQGHPMRVGGFFQRGHDENVIALNLESMESGSLEVIFHEYTHLLMRRNDRVWPLWLKEGMADVYSTFLIENSRVCLGVAKRRHIELLAKQPLIPLSDLFKVSNESPQYNERDQRGIYYAESWALTHYLVMGNSPLRKKQFADFARRLREGEPAEAAFTSAFKSDLSAMEDELRRYLLRGRFEPVCYRAGAVAAMRQPQSERSLARVEVLYQLGNLLLHCHRLDEAEAYFKQAQKLAPESPRPHEGLGFVAESKKNFGPARKFFEDALARGSTNFRTHFGYARALQANASGAEPSARDKSGRIQELLQRSIQLMPAFAPAHYLLGMLDLRPKGDLARAAQHLSAAIDLEPENEAYLLGFAQLQILRRENEAARRTLTALTRPGADPELRRSAETLLKTLDESSQRPRILRRGLGGS